MHNHINSFLVTISPSRRNQINIGILLIILFSFIVYFPKMLERARVVDQVAGETISNWDDKFYQILAINLLHGFGYSDMLHFPLGDYQITPPPPVESYPFHFPPGTSLWLSAVYSLLGQQTIYARYSYAIAIWFSAVMMPLLGYVMAGGKGAVAGGLAGFYYINFGAGVQGQEGFYAGRVLSEPLSVFWLIFFALSFTSYLKKSRPILLYIAGVALVGFITCRGNFMIAYPLLYIYLFIKHPKRKDIIGFIVITALPVLAWSAYGSITKGELVFFNTNSESFPTWNNMDVITGFGPFQINQGGWQPGFAYNEKGELIITNSNQAKLGENYWLKGFSFWLENPEKLPLLFYVKMRAAGWYNDSAIDVPYFEARVYFVAVGYLLFSIGFREHCKRVKRLAPDRVLLLQFGLISLLLMMGNRLPFFEILLIWLAILIIAVAYPIERELISPIQLPSWFTIFLVVYLVSTLLFGGNQRFHYPLDLFLMFVCFLGLGLSLEKMFTKNAFLAGLYLLVFSYPLFTIYKYLYDWVINHFHQVF